MNTVYLCLFIACTAGKSFLYPHTLLNTDVPCSAIKDCVAYYNNSWCACAGVLCIQHYCKLIPEYPCRATQQCIEAEKRCVDKECAIDDDCNNGLYCDGTEVCSHGHCITDPQRPSCHYTGGECDESRQQCYQPKARLAWRSSVTNIDTDDDVSISLSRLSNTGGGGGRISQTSANMTTLIIIGTVTGFFILIVLFVALGRSMRWRTQ